MELAVKDHASDLCPRSAALLCLQMECTRTIHHASGLSGDPGGSLLHG